MTQITILIFYIQSFEFKRKSSKNTINLAYAPHKIDRKLEIY